MGKLAKAEEVVHGTPMENLNTALAKQHPFDALMGLVLEELGGKDFVLEWAKENPSRFITIMSKMRPTLQPTQGLQGHLQIVINNSLGRTALDVEGEIIEDA